MNLIHATLVVTLVMSGGQKATDTVTSGISPAAQADIYLVESAEASPTLRPFEDIVNYTFEYRRVEQDLLQKVRSAAARHFQGLCSNVVEETFSVYQFDLGSDGQLLMLSCNLTSSGSSTVYYQLDSKGRLKVIEFQFPVFNNYSPRTLESPPKIVGYESRRILPNSEVLQGRIVSRSTPRAGELWGFRAEWVWKIGAGAEFNDCFSLRSGDDGNMISMSLARGP